MKKGHSDLSQKQTTFIALFDCQRLKVPEINLVPQVESFVINISERADQFLESYTVHQIIWSHAFKNLITLIFIAW